MKKLTLLATLIILNIFILEGCKTHSSNSITNDPSLPEKGQEPIQVFQGRSEDFTQPIRFEKNLGLHAKGSGPVLIISMQNQGQESIKIIPQNFALITGPYKETDFIRITPGSADLSEFAPLLLSPGDQGTRRLSMTAVSNVSGTRLVFRHPEKKLDFFVPVE
jgi:hypothetical protein